MEHEISLPPEQLTISESSLWAKLPLLAGVVGIAALAVAFFAGMGEGDDKLRFLYSYAFAYFYFLTFALGGLFFVILQYLTRSGWSVVVRRLAEHISTAMPFFVVLFIPIALYHTEIYHWSHPEGDALLEGKAAWLNSQFWIVRSVFYLAVWTALSLYFARASQRQDESGDTAITGTLQKRSALGMVLFAVTLNFAAFDWIMSLDPHWFSTIFGVYIFAGCVITILSTVILLSHQLQGSGYLKGIVTGEHYHDLGKLLFGFTVFWAYIGFSQFMLIWYGNIPEETTFFAHRWGDGPGGWQGVSILLAAGHFGVPFLFLLSSDVKRTRWAISLACVWMLTMHMVDIYWLVIPNLALVSDALHGFHPHWLDAACLVGVGGIFVAAVGWRLKGGSLVPVKDPRLGESLAFENM